MKARLKAYPEKMALRAKLAEHPFGTLKRAMGHGYFLSKGLENVSTEMSLSVLTYNLKRMLTIVGSKNLIQALMTVGHVLYKNTVQHIPFPTINVQDYNFYPNTPFPTFYTGCPRWERGELGRIIDNVSFLCPFLCSNSCYLLPRRKKMISCLEYIHYNPVVAGYVESPEHWMYSSARNYYGIPGLIDVETCY